MRKVLLIVPFSLLASCKEEAPLPFVGDCAVYPDVAYDYGDIGIGSCLSGPVSLVWVDDGGAGRLLVANANPFLDFTGGSVSSIDLGVVPLDGSTTLSHKAVSSVLEMPSFPGYMAAVPERDLLLVTNRLTEAGRTRVGFDDLYFVDISDPGALAFAPVAEDGAYRLELMSDPDPLVYDPESGYAFVANLTSHTISVVDLGADPVDVIDATPEASATDGRFIDADGSGSQAVVASLDITYPEQVINQDWTLLYGEGTHRIWYPGVEGIVRVESPGDGVWTASAAGAELTLEDTEVAAMADPQLYYDSTLGLMLFWVDPDASELHAAYAEEELLGWDDVGALLSGREGEWDEQIGGPNTLLYEGLTWLFYDGTDSSGSGGIGLALSGDALNFTREGDVPLLSPGNGEHDAVRAADPAVLYDAQSGRWRMLYGAWDGSRWTIGHAESDDLLEWEVDDTPVFAPEGVDAAAPAWYYLGGEFRMVYSRRGADGVWGLAQAWSIDGVSWVDEGQTAALQGSPTGDEPPGLGWQPATSEGWGLFAENLGSLQLLYEGGDVIFADSFGFSMQVSSGAVFTEAHTPSAGRDGVQADSWLPDQGLVYTTLFRTVAGQEQRRIGLARWTPGAVPQFEADPILTGDKGSFDEEGVSHPVVFADPSGSGWLMLYAGTDEDGVTAIGLAESADGYTWTTDHRAVLSPGEDWDSLLLAPGSVVVEEDGSLSLWYTGSDGSRSRIGQAVSEDGRSWTRADTDWSLGTGAPGEFDDSAVRQPFVLRDGDTLHLWYAGFDGTTWQVGYASSSAGADWVRSLDTDDLARPVLQPYEGSYDEDGLSRPLVALLDGRYELLLTGVDGGIPRVGRATGSSPDRLYRTPSLPTVGDRLEFTTRAGDDDDLEAIPLSRAVDNYGTPSGVGVSMMALDSDRGFLYVASKLSSYIFVLDVRDDSTETWTDGNYMGIEALMFANTDVGSANFRGLLPASDLGVLYALNGQPESVMVFNTAAVEDNSISEAYREAVVGYLPSSRGRERDAGALTSANIGPAQIVRLGDRLFVSEFNNNTVAVYDLRLGSYGALIAEVPVLDDNPNALAISPDGTLLAVANIVGQQTIEGRSDATVVLVDIDPQSPTAYQVVARIANQ